VLKKIWSDPVWSKVIANAIWYALVAVAPVAVAAVVVYFGGWWPSMAAIASRIISQVVASTPVPNWLFTPICLLAIIGVIFLVMPFVRRIAWQDWREYRLEAHNAANDSPETQQPSCNQQEERVKIEKWRQMVHEIILSVGENQQNWGKEVRRQLETHPDFPSLKPRLSQDMIAQIYRPTHFIMGTTIPSNLSLLYDEIVRIEKELGSRQPRSDRGCPSSGA
jgi:hypothetical protein